MKPDKLAYFYVLLVFWGLGISVFFDKLATNRLGNRSIIPILFSTIAALIPLALIYIFAKSFHYDQKGMMWMMAATVFNSVGVIAYYLLFVRSEISWAVPLTALYPILPILIAFIFLKESITLTKIIGIILSLGAIIFLNL